MNNAGWRKGLWVLLTMTAWHSTVWADGPISIEDPWVRDAPPHAEMSAAYLIILNHSDQEQTLLGISSPQFQKVEIHKTQMAGGQVHMQRLDKVAIAAHGSLEFKPGAYHLMMIHPAGTFKKGDMVELRLRFKDESQLTVQAQIRESAEQAPAHDHHDMMME